MTDSSLSDLSFGRLSISNSKSDFIPALLGTAVDRRKPATTLLCSPDKLSKLIRQLRQLLGETNVLADSKSLDPYSTCSLPNGTRPAAVARPGTTEDVRQLVMLASTLRLPMHPVSGGKTWGFGSSCAPGDGWLIVDLNRMNRILEVNDELAYAVIEPGVTQGQLCEFLLREHPSLMFDINNSGPDASVMGSVLQRCAGSLTQASHFSRLCGMEVVLADGRIVHTGFRACGDQARAQHVCPWSQGPYVDGLFTQSHLGVVTQMGVWLHPRPDFIEAFSCSVPRDEQLGDLIEAIRWLKLHGVARGAVHIVNDLRAIAENRQFPSELAPSNAVVPAAIRASLREEYGVGAWNVLGGLCGSREEVSWMQKMIRQRLSGVATVQFFSKRKVSIARHFADVTHALGFGQQNANRLNGVNSFLDLISGIPQYNHLRSAAWRSNRPIDKCSNPGDIGLICLLPVIEATSNAVSSATQVINQVLEDFEFDPLLAYSTVTERALMGTINICFERDDHTARKRAKECAQVLIGRLADNGWYLSRRT